MTLNETIICMIVHNIIDSILADNIISMVNISDFSAWTLHSFTFIYVTTTTTKRENISWDHQTSSVTYGLKKNYYPFIEFQICPQLPNIVNV